MQIKLPITSLGMVTPLGHGVITSAAAARAGLSRAGTLPGVTIEGSMDDEDHVVASASGHRISPLTDGFLQTGVWLRIGVEVLRDAVVYGTLPPPTDTSFWRRTALFAVVPDVTSERLGWPDDDEVGIGIGRVYAEPLCSLAGVDLAFAPAQVAVGHAGWAAAVCAARGALGRVADRAIVLGVDSYVDTLSLTVLGAAERLKSPDSPTGMLPGEAGGCFLLERSADRGGRAEASLLSAHHAPSRLPPPAEDEDPTAFIAAVGRELGAAAATALAEAGVPAGFAGDVFLDLNGEEWRARVWATALLQLRGHLDLDRCNTVLPCASFGEIGAASGPVAVGLAVRAFARGYARDDKALVLSTSENGDVAAAVVTRGR
jgi:3-oxoacyl-[acyl-carrier-protein] synthase-1